MPQQGVLEFQGVSLPVTGAAFGRPLPVRPTKLRLRKPEPLDGCELEHWDHKYSVLAARSPNCTFADRGTEAEKYGLKAVIVYNTLEGIYRNRTFAEPFVDYECRNGRSFVHNPSTMKFQGYPLSECAGKCPSRRCLLTGARLDEEWEVCCAWDTAMTMSSSEDVDVVMAFLTMRDADALGDDIDVTLWGEETFGWSAMGIWALGVLTCALAAWTADDDNNTEEETVEKVETETEPESVELTPGHAFGFVAVASLALLVLFYSSDAERLVSVAYGFAAAGATTAVVWKPLILRLKRRHRFDDIIAGSLGVAIALVWLLLRDHLTLLSWVLQDFFGVCVSLMFLRVVKVNSLRVAAMLLSLAFFYDVFFVFISPYFFGGESVMVKVATGTGPSRDPDYCDKYPSDAQCRSTELPMLLLLPQSDGGYAMLGLGDIVLPALLVAFAARVDRRRKIFRYFPILVFGYAVGLGAANTAVAVFQVGQPALLYLVPSTLGLFCAIARADGILSNLWHPERSTQPPSSSGDRGVVATEEQALLHKISV